MRFLITGGNGFLAKNLTQFLVDLGHEVSCLNRKLHFTSVKYSLVSPNLKVKKLKNFEDLRDDSFDGIFHLATRYSQTYSTVELSQLLEASVNLTRQLCNLVLSTKTPMIVSGSYLQEVTNLTNSDLFAYATIKNLGEKFVESTCINYAVTRQFESYGEFDHRNRILNRLIDSIILQKELEVSNSIISLNYLHVNDICAAYYHIFNSLNSSQTDSRKFIISSHQEIKFTDLVSETEKVTGNRAKLIYSKSKEENFTFGKTFNKIDRPKEWTPSHNLLSDLNELISNRCLMLNNRKKST